MNRFIHRLSIIFSFAASQLLPASQPPLVLAMDDDAKMKIVIDMYEDYKSDFKTVADIAPLAAMALTGSEKVVFVDVRSQEEMRVSMLPGAVSQKEYLTNQGRFDNHTVVVYCTIGYRSGIFAKKRAGTMDNNNRIYNLRGGLLAWVLEGGKVVDEKGESRRIHVYGRKWNYPPEGFEATW